MVNYLYMNKIFSVVIFTQGCLLLNPMQAESPPQLQLNGTLDNTTVHMTTTKTTIFTENSNQSSKGTSTPKSEKVNKVTSAQKSKVLACHTCTTTDRNSSCAHGKGLKPVAGDGVCASGHLCWTILNVTILDKNDTHFAVERKCESTKCSADHKHGTHCNHNHANNATSCTHCCTSNHCNNLHAALAGKAENHMYGHLTWATTLVSSFILTVPFIN